MTFKDCEYYEKYLKQDHCPFVCVCNKNCYFTYNTLLEDFKELQSEYNACNEELSGYEMENREMEDISQDLDTANRNLCDVIKYCKELITELGYYKHVEPIEAELFDDAWKQEINYFIQTEGNNMKRLNINFVCKDTKYTPEYANETDACMDLKIVVDEPIMEKWYLNQIGTNECLTNNNNEYWLMPGEKKLFGTGIQVAIPKDFVMLLYPRSSTGSKLSIMLANTTGVIDAGYRDEVKLCLVNYGDKAVKLEDGQRIAQFMIIHRPKLGLYQVEDNESFRNGDRGGGFGSTGA